MNITGLKYCQAQQKPSVYQSLQEIDGLTCARCGRKTITRNRIKEIRHSIEAPAKEALQNHVFDDARSTQAFKVLRLLAQKEPDKTLREIVARENTQAALSQADEETQKLIRKLTRKALKITVKANEELNRIRPYKKRLNPNKQIVFSQLEIWANRYKDKSLSEILKLPEVQEENKLLSKKFINEHAINSKSRRENPYRFFLQNKNEDDKTIVEKIIGGLENTFEHVKRDSDNGQRVQSNGITLCFDCNNYISEQKYPEVIAQYPQMKENTQKQIDEVINYINNGQLINHESYPEKIKHTLYNESDHILDIDISKYKP